MRTYFNLLPDFPKTAGSAKEFKDWEDNLKVEYPTRYRINELVGTVMFNCIQVPSWRLRDMKYWVLNRVHPKYTMHKINIKSISPGYHDPMELIIHAPFDVFCQFMDRIYAGDSYVLWYYEEGDEHRQYADFDEIERVNKRWDEMQKLYGWWMIERVNREDIWDEKNPRTILPREWGTLAPFNDDYRDTPEVQEWRAHAKRSNEQQQVWAQDDEDMLIRLIKIWPCLWD
jgi:hypothetical protein